MTTQEKLQLAAAQAYNVDSGIAGLLAQVNELIGDLQREQRPHEAGILIGVSANLKDSYYRKLAGQLRDMHERD